MTEQADLARAVSAHGATVKLILCGTNAAGNVDSLKRLRRAGDAVVVLDAEGWWVKKCRWLPDCPQQFSRQSRESEAPRVLH